VIVFVSIVAFAVVGLPAEAIPSEHLWDDCGGRCLVIVQESVANQNEMALNVRSPGPPVQNGRFSNLTSIAKEVRSWFCQNGQR
jgi:hypothetical protein